MTDCHRRSVLVVDDESAILNILTKLLTYSGYRVECRADGLEGLKCFQESPFDVVVVDRGMPVMSGEEMAKRIKETHPQVPIILITGLPHLVVVPEQYVAVLSKPFRPGELMDLIGQSTASVCRCGD